VIFNPKRKLSRHYVVKLICWALVQNEHETLDCFFVMHVLKMYEYGSSTQIPFSANEGCLDELLRPIGEHVSGVEHFVRFHLDLYCP
jgi:hypothetical protein